MPETLNAERRLEYQTLFDSLIIRPARQAEVEKIVDKIAKNRARYEAVGNPLKIPWFFVGVIHSMEASLDFTTHLHNGNPLSARTTDEPPNRPPKGTPPFTWEFSADDALRFEGFNGKKDWSLPAILFRLEQYNGFGYRKKKINTPYLWSFSQHYEKGKFVKDKKFDPNAGSSQCGAAVLLRRMAERGIIAFDALNEPTEKDVEKLTPLVRYAPKTFSEDALRLQELLNLFPGIFVKVDGLAGKRTSDAVKRITGNFLAGDPRDI